MTSSTLSLVLAIVYWASVGLVVYSYVLYPILLGTVAKLFGKGSQTTARETMSPEEWPSVSLIIAAYKEEQVILERIHNALQMDYPADRLEILIGCDGNEDTTGELVQTVDDPRVQLMQFPVRRGKPSVLNDCVAAANGELLAFSDANTFWDQDALKRLVSHFDELGIGGVCGQLLLTDPHTGENVDGLYWKYENQLKRWEAKIGALLGVNGAIYALRRELWQPIPANSIVDDFLIGMRVHGQGSRLLFDERAVAREESAPNMQAEFHRRARIGAGGFQSLFWLWPLLNPLRGSVAWAFWSHKVLRWFCPAFLAVAFIANLTLIREPLYQGLFAAQVLFYAIALLGRWIPGNGLAARLTRLTTMFVSMNAALAVGFCRWFRNNQSGAWKRTARSQEMDQNSRQSNSFKLDEEKEMESVNS
ncbi:MAG: glycosyltransferase family 2 protein [Planctomycetaceae bacterium]|nr:glycosyltransferase family 2 protein [Planctomycetaceae bacterium]